MVVSGAVVNQVENHRVGVRRDTRDARGTSGRGMQQLIIFLLPQGGEERLAGVLSKEESRVVHSLSSDERMIDKVLLQF